MCSGCADSISQCHTPESKSTTPEVFNSSSPARSIFSSSFSLISPSNYTNGNSKDIHSLTIKKLDQSLQKFASVKKINNTSKTNLLRLSLLKYLRYPPPIYKSISILLATSLTDVNVDLINFEATVLLNWWTNLLNLLINDYQSIQSLDKNAYLESISRLLSSNIWKYVTLHSSTFTSIIENYNQLILKTFEMTLSRLNLKSSSIAFEIFAGKIFSLAFFNLPLISHGLSFLLNTKIKSFKLIHSLCFNDFSDFNGIINDLSSQFPNHLNLMLNSSLKPRPTKFIIENKFLNSIHPPREKINGIHDTRGPWTLKWCSLDSINLFCSFLRNYLSLLSVHFKNFPSIMINDNYIFLSPGFMCLLTHCFEIFDAEINFKLKNLKLSSNLSQPNVSITPTTSSLLYSSNSGYLKELPSEKIFNVLRDLLINPRTPYECLIDIGFIKGIENIFKILILNTKVLEVNKIELIFNLFIDFVRSLDVIIDFNSLLDSSIVTPFLDHLDWKFWLNTILKLLNSNNSQLESRAILVLYKLWEFISWNNYDIGNSLLKAKCEDNWISNLKLNLKLNLIIYLTKDSKWNHIFGNYNPLTRQLFIKLLIWKVLSLRYIGLSSIGETKSDTDQIYKEIEMKLLNTLNKTKNINFKPTGPILNKKFSIREIKCHLDKSKIRTYPFEVIDDFEYSNSSSLNGSGFSQQFSEKPATVGNKSNNKSNKIQDFFAKPNSANNSSSNLFGKLFRSDSASSKKLFKKPPSISSLSSIRSSDNSISGMESTFSKLSFADHVEEDYYFDNSNLKPAPESLLKSIELPKYTYEFNLVNDDLKIQSFIQNLNTLNSNGSKFKFGGLNIDFHYKNYELNLPSLNMDLLYNKAYFRNQNSESNKLQSNGDTNKRESLKSGLKLDLNGNDYLNMMNFQPENVSTPTNDTLFGNSDSTCNSFTSAKGTDNEVEFEKEEKEEVQLPFFVNLANAIHEFNNEVEVFNEFIEARMLELDSNDIIRSPTTSKWIDGDEGKEEEEREEEEKEEEEEYNDKLMIEIQHSVLNKYQLTPMAMRKLQRRIPQIIPEIQNDKLNAY